METIKKTINTEDHRQTANGLLCEALRMFVPAEVQLGCDSGKQNKDILLSLSRRQHKPSGPLQFQIQFTALPKSIEPINIAENL